MQRLGTKWFCISDFGSADIMTAEHLLQHCRLHNALRRDMWPELTLLRDKLYGNLEELRRTATFMRATGISI